MKTTNNTTPTSPLRVGCLALLTAVSVAFAPQSACAKDQVPFRAAFDTVFESTVNFPFASIHVIGEGQATHLGRTTIETTDQIVNLVTGEATATYLFAAANGHELVVEMKFSALPTPTGFALSGTWEIIAGTGRFANASGSGMVDGRADFTGENDGVGEFTMTGTISSRRVFKRTGGLSSHRRLACYRGSLATQPIWEGRRENLQPPREAK